MSIDPFAPIAAPASPSRRATECEVITPVPADAPAAPASHPKLGKPSSRWTYRDANGGLLGYVCRFELPDGKIFRPLIYARPKAGGRTVWRWESWPAPRPLYGIDRLTAHSSDAVVVVCEGEKAADAAARLLPRHVVVTSSNGAKAAAKADWSPLRGRHVVIWPDADSDGLTYATMVAAELDKIGARSVAIVSPPQSCAVKWDAADAVAEGWDTARATALIAHARPAPNGGGVRGGADVGSSRRRRPAQRDLLIGVTDDCELWHDASSEAFATVQVNRHREHYPVRSRQFRIWLSGKYYSETGTAIGGQALEDGIRILEARAVNDGAEHDRFVRVGHHAGKLYLDLCDLHWRAVEITREGWRVIRSPPVKFLRTPSMRPLPEPEAGSLIEELRQFANVSDAGFILVVSWLVAALRPFGPYPVLVLNGEQASGKTVFTKMLRKLIDPTLAAARWLPKDDRDLVVSAFNNHVLSFDNLSRVDAWISDAFCRLSTGGGFATRTLHTDRDETIFDGQRPILLNGIGSLTDRPDLADRAVTIHLRAIPEEDRRAEDELWDAFEAAWPRILGALLDAVSRAVRDIKQTKLSRAVRMADFEKWVTAAEPALGWAPGAFGAAYRDNRSEAAVTAFDADPVAGAIQDFVLRDHPTGWSGTPTDLLCALNGRAPDTMRKQRVWPQTAQSLGNRVERIAPLLRSKGFAVDRRHSGARLIVIAPPPPSNPDPFGD